MVIRRTLFFKLLESIAVRYGWRRAQRSLPCSAFGPHPDVQRGQAARASCPVLFSRVLSNSYKKHQPNEGRCLLGRRTSYHATLIRIICLTIGLAAAQTDSSQCGPGYEYLGKCTDRATAATAPCCSSSGFCGNTAAWCCGGCQADYGSCNIGCSPPPPPGDSPVSTPSPPPLSSPPPGSRPSSVPPPPATPSTSSSSCTSACWVPIIAALIGMIGAVSAALVTAYFVHGKAQKNNLPETTPQKLAKRTLQLTGFIRKDSHQTLQEAE